MDEMIYKEDPRPPRVSYTDGEAVLTLWFADFFEILVCPDKSRGEKEFIVYTVANRTHRYQPSSGFQARRASAILIGWMKHPGFSQPI
jgi:hypothetical protein